jgi:hypothetical protein
MCRQIFIVFFIWISSLILINSVNAQLKSHEIGMLWETMFPTGSLAEYSPLQNQMTYPGGDFFFQSRKNLAGRGLWIGASNWTDKFNIFHTNYVSEGGFLNDEATDFTFRINNRKRVRNRLPRVEVNGRVEVRLLDSRSASTRSTTIPADEQIETTWATDMGVQVTMTSHAYANQNHNSYIILEYTFTNNGNADGDRNSIELPNQNLEGVYFGFEYHLIPGGDRGHEQVNQNDDWAEYYGNQAGDTLRGLFFLYDGNADENARPGDDIGDPDQFTGEFLSPQFPAIGVLHADKAYNDDTDDRNQPVTVDITPRRIIKSKTKENTDNELYTVLTSGEQSRGTVGQAPQPYDATVQEPIGMLAFGPYDLPFGESIHIVLYETVGSISQECAINCGKAWKDGTLTFNGLSGDAAKNALIATGRDSLSMHASRVEYAWNIGMKDIPDPPPAPDLYITSGPGRVELEWSAVDEEEDPDTGILDFSGYRVYRAEGTYINPYRLIRENGGNSGNPVETTYWDEEVEVGKNYFYYVTAYDDGSQNTMGIYPGQSLESSPYYNRNYETPGIPQRGASTHLDSVYVVPNPFHIQGLAYGGTFVNDYREIPRLEDKISFVGLPAIAKIRVFTMKGDLVATIDHPNPTNPSSIPGSSDEEWFQITDSYQVLKSGVYIFYVDGWDKDGNPLGSTTGKFIIIR